MKRPEPHATSQLLQRQSRALKRHLPSAVKGDDKAVHRARVASRRLRESVLVLATGLKGSRANKARRKIRRLTRALGMVRELDVALRAVDELGSGNEIPRSATDELRAHILTERQRRRDEMLEALDAVDAAKLGRRLASVAAAIDAAESLEWRQSLSKRLLKRSKRLKAVIDEAGQLYAPDRLHQVRIAVKKLRYGLELAAESGAQAAGPLTRTLRRAQDLLGRIQDLQVVRSHVEAVQAASARAPRKGLATIARRIDDESRRLHGRYVAMAQPLSEIALDVRRLVVPQIVHPARSRQLKMPLRRSAAAPRQSARR